METPVRTTVFQPTNRITLGKTDNNIPIIRSKLERVYPPPSARRPEPETHSNWSSTKTTAAPVQSIIVDPDSSRPTSSVQSRNESKNFTISELGKRTASLQIQTSTASGSYSESSKSPKVEQEESASKTKRCISPLPDSIARSIKANDYEGSANSCKPALYRFFM